jgi:23S rRNA pseudouridine2457 synthase
VPKTYHVLVERIPNAEALAKLQSGVLVDGRLTLPAQATLLEPQPIYPPRNPPVRFRKNVLDVWVALQIREGKNRQVRRMTASVGHPTLRLIRVAIGQFPLGDLPAGKWRILDRNEQTLLHRSQDPQGNKNREL